MAVETRGQMWRKRLGMSIPETAQPDSGRWQPFPIALWTDNEHCTSPDCRLSVLWIEPSKLTQIF